MQARQEDLFRIQAAQEWSQIADHDLPGDEIWAVVRDNNAYHTVHRFHPYFAMCPPPIARQAIERYSRPGDLVLDPFCGAGVTMVEAMITGRRSIGIDILAMATFIATVKTTLVDLTTEDALAVADRAASFAADAEDLSASLPPVFNLDYWFSPDSQHRMAAILAAVREEAEPARRSFLLLAFSGIVRAISKAGNLEAHLHIKEGKPAADALKLFRRRLFDMATRERDFARLLPDDVAIPQVFEADSRDLSALIQTGSVDFIFTSPPYGTGTKYASIYRLQLELLGLGRPKKPLDSVKDFSAELGKCIAEMHRVLRPGGYLTLLYGTNRQFSSRDIANLAETNGFRLETTIACPVIDESKMVRGDYRRSMANEHLLVLART